MSRIDAEAMVGRECLSLTLSGPWGHFRRVEGNIVKQTYRLIPRTTLAGLLAAVLGLERDSYYEVFGPENSAVAVEPVGRLRTMNLPMNTLTTAEEGMTKLNSRGNLTVSLPDPTAPRQQHNYEMLVDPTYRVDLWLEEDAVFERLRDQLASGRSHYPPSLGLSECLATIEYLGTTTVESGSGPEATAVDSAIPEAVDAVVVDEDTDYHLERSPAFMEADDRGRTTTGFRSLAYEPGGGPLRATGVSTNVVDGREVVFG